MPHNPTDFLTTPEAAEYIGLKVETLETWRSRKCGPCYYKIGGAVKYRVVDLEAWLATRRVETDTEK